MTIFVRLMEKLTGEPHQHRNAQKVADVARELRQEVHELSTTLRPYTESEDPLVALMTDVFNQRQMQQQMSNYRNGAR
jgi:hypothetical protein